MTAKRRAELETLKDAVLAPATRATIEELLAEIDSLKADNKRLATMASDTAPAFAKLQSELAEVNATFDARYKADMRAREMWHKAGGDEMTWPDHADLCVWLLQELAKIKAQLADVEDENGDLRDQYVSYLQELAEAREELAEARGYIRRGR